MDVLARLLLSAAIGFFWYNGFREDAQIAAILLIWNEIAALKEERVDS